MSDIRLSGLNSSYPSGTTAERPASSTIGALYFNTDLGVLQVYTPNGWFVYQNPATPTAPANVSATDQPSGRAYNNGQASVSFTPNSSGGTATLFTITPSPSTSPSTFTGNSSPIVVTNLQSSQQYTYTVTSNNLSGTSSASSASAGVTATTVPQAPTIDAVTAGDTLATVAYTAGATGGATATFTATSTPGSLTGTGASPITVSGLTNGTSYTFAVTATNANGTSAASAASSAVTPSEPTIIIGDYDALATATLTSSASSVTFSGIPSGYKHLQIRYNAMASSPTDSQIRFNGDSSSAYSYHLLRGTGSPTAQAYSYSSQGSIMIQYNIGHAGSGAAAIVDILDYASPSKNTTIRSFAGFDNNSIGEIDLWSGAWYNLDPVTSIVISTATAPTYNANSSFSLYGVK